jgi:hypothetical protein
VKSLTFLVTSLLVALCFCSSVDASVLKLVQFREGKSADLTFDSKVDQSQIQMEFFADTVQLTLSNASVYPAKMIPVRGDLVSKIFAYQYSPKVVRCRFSLKGKAEDFKGRVRATAHGKQIRVEFSESATAQNSSENQDSELEENQLMDKVIRMSQAAPEVAPKTEAKVETKVELKSESKAETKSEVKLGQKTESKKGLSSVWSAFAKMGALLVGLGLIALFMKKGRNASPLASQSNYSEAAEAGMQGSWFNRIKQIAKGTLSREGRILQIVSTQYIGPKKSLMVVRFSGRLLVLGVSNDNINLITQISDKTGDEILEDHTGSMSSQSDVFSDILISEDLKSNSAPLASLSDAAPESLGQGARSRIKSRLEGLKPL